MVKMAFTMTIAMAITLVIWLVNLSLGESINSLEIVILFNTMLISLHVILNTSKKEEKQ